MKKEQEKFQRNIILYDFRSRNFTETQKENHLTKKYVELDENKYKEELKVLKDRIQNETFSTNVIFLTLVNINLDSKLDGDLCCKTDAFLNIYRVIKYQYRYLEK